MNTVILKTKNAAFQFDRKDADTRLNNLVTEYGVDEAETVLKRISIADAEPKLIQIEHEYFGYIALELIGAGKASVICQICGKTYKANQLKPFSVGHGKSPFDIDTAKKRGIRSLFSKKKQPALFGGKGYECPEGHVLISAITWKT